MRSVSLLLTLSLFAFGCPQSHSNTDEDDIHEAVLRYQVNGWYSTTTRDEDKKDDIRREIENRLHPMIVHISVNGKDPSPEFLARFKDEKRIFRPASEVRLESRKEASPPRALGIIIFSSEHIKWLAKDSVDVEGGYYCGPLCASGNVFHLRKESGKWQVVKAEMQWIS